MTKRFTINKKKEKKSKKYNNNKYIYTVEQNLTFLQEFGKTKYWKTSSNLLLCYVECYMYVEKAKKVCTDHIK